MTDHDAQWRWWRGACQAQDFDGYLGTAPIHADEPQSGFFETRHRNQQTSVVTRGVTAIWRNDAGELCGRAGKSTALKPETILHQWPYLAKRPIAHEVYKQWLEIGKFPDEVAAEARAREDGLNDAGDLDQHEFIKDRIDDLAREADRIIAKGAAKSQEEIDTAADLADRLKKLEDRAEKLRTEEKAPHLAECRGVDLKWGGLTAAAAYAKQQLKNVVITPFMRAEIARRDAELARAREIAAKAGAPPPSPPPPVRAGIAASRKVALRDEKSAIIEDYAKTLAYFADNSKVRDLIQQLANASVKTGTTPDGCKLNIQQAAA